MNPYLLFWKGKGRNYHLYRQMFCSVFLSSFVNGERGLYLSNFSSSHCLSSSFASSCGSSSSFTSLPLFLGAISRRPPLHSQKCRREYDSEYSRRRFHITSISVSNNNPNNINDNANYNDNNNRNDNDNDNNENKQKKRESQNKNKNKGEKEFSVFSPPSKSFFDKVDRDWEKSWQNEITPWDVGKAAPPLLSLLREDILPSMSKNNVDLGKSNINMNRDHKDRGRKRKVLIPGCGSGYELLAFAKEGFDLVIGIDISPTAISIAKEKLANIIDTDSTLSAEAKTQINNRISFEVADFFSLKGKYDIIFDYTFCVALPPEMRIKWANQMKDLLSSEDSEGEGGELITLIFPVPPDHYQLESNFKDLDIVNGPPYDASPSLYKYLLETKNDLECIALKPCNNSIKPRRGKEWIGRWKWRKKIPGS